MFGASPACTCRTLTHSNEASLIKQGNGQRDIWTTLVTGIANPSREVEARVLGPLREPWRIDHSPRIPRHKLGLRKQLTGTSENEPRARASGKNADVKGGEKKRDLPQA